jgi:nucleotide-binding universal stress UspA family protein
MAPYEHFSQLSREMVMMRKILVGYDGSDPARKAFELGLDLARKYGAELHLLAVARPPEFGGEVETEAVVENSRQHYDDLLQALTPALAFSPELQTFFEVAIGHPAEQIVLYAEKHAVDHIVVGHRGHSLFERWLLGSVARQVVAYAPCAVTVVRG